MPMQFGIPTLIETKSLEECASMCKELGLNTVLSVRFGLNVSMIYDADIGHIPPQFQIINGSFGTVDYSNSKMKFTQIYK